MKLRLLYEAADPIYIQVGHNVGSHLWWWDPEGGLRIEPVESISAQEAWGGPANEMTITTHDDHEEVRNAHLAGRIDHGKKLITMRPNASDRASLTIRRAVNRKLSDLYRGYKVVEY